MADLSYIDRDLEVKIVGQDSTGTRANYVSADANGNLAVKDSADGPVTPGAVAANSILIGGQFNTTLPTLTNTQQSAFQLDASGRLITASNTTDGALLPTYINAVGGESPSGNLEPFAVDAVGNMIVVGTVASGSAASGSPVLIAGADTSGNARSIKTNASGAVYTVGSFSTAGLVYADMNVANGGIARGTSVSSGILTTLFSYTGAGAVYGFTINANALTAGSGWQIHLLLDGTDVFSAAGINSVDITSNTIYDIGAIAGDPGFVGFNFVDKSLRWVVPGNGAVQFSTSCVVKVQLVAGGAQTFHAGLISLVEGTF